VMIHRGAFGAFERMVAYLIELYAGAFPTWLHPVQVIVIPIAEAQHEYAAKVAAQLRSARLRVEVDDRAQKMQRKIRDAHARKVPYMAIVGEREAVAEHVNIRDRSNTEVDSTLDSFVNMVATEVAERRR
jgi:threonyl-tRNA synthetase